MSKSNVALETVQKLKEGQAPSNEQIDQVMETTKEYLQDPHNNLPPQTQKVLQSAAELVDATQQMLKNKNPDEDLQKLVLEGAQAAKNVAEAGVQTAKETAPAKGQVAQKAQKAGEAAQQAGQAALNVFKMMLTSGEFRSWFLDFADFLHDVLFRVYQTQSSTGPNAPSSFTPMDTSSGKKAEAKVEWYTGLSKDEIKRKLSTRMLNLLRRMNTNPTFSQGARDMLDSLGEMKEQAKKAGSNFKDRITDDDDVQMALDHARSLIENFSGRSMDMMLDALERFAKDLSEDNGVDQWLQDARKLVEEAITKPDSLNGEEFSKRVDELIDRADKLQEKIKNRGDFQLATEEAKCLFNCIKNDPDVKNFQQKAEKFFKQFTYTDAKGQRHFNTDLVSELTHCVVPMLLKHLEEIPLPKIEDHNADYEYCIDNLSISGYDIVPKHVHFFMNSELDFNLRELETERGRTSALLRVTNIKTKMPGIKYWVHKKTFPSLEDRGVADVSIGGRGATLKIYLKIENLFSDKPTFAFSRVQFFIDTLNVDIVKTQHTIITPILASMWNNKIKSTIEEQVQKKVYEMAHSLEGNFNELITKYPPSKITSIAAEKIQQGSDVLQQKVQEAVGAVKGRD